jgi:tRNA dimethylallyltransferase
LDRTDLHIIAGQTASGKSAVAFDIARRLGTEIVCVDSMMIYQHMDKGTAKPSEQAREQVRYHLLDVASPDEDFSTARFVELADAAIADVAARGLPVLLEGGTPLYLKALTEGIFRGPGRDPAYREELKKRAVIEGSEVLCEDLRRVDPVSAGRICNQDVRRIIRALEVYRSTGRPISELQTQFGGRRPEYRRRIAALRHDRDVLRQRITARINAMFDNGLVEEVRSLGANGLGRTASQAIGYLEVGRILAGEITIEEARTQMQRRTWRLARRQMTWLRSFPDVTFYEVPPGESRDKTVRAMMEILRLS